jgi:hypothetical protein
MSALDAALEYATRGWPVFPCGARKKPCTDHGFQNATTNEQQIREWWTRWPHALIGVPTGELIGCVVLDIDTKDGVNGFRTLDEIDCLIRPATPTTLTRSGGAHLYFVRPEGGLRNTNGERGKGIGPGLDWRGDGGYVIVPAAGSGYKWDYWNFETCRPIPVPEHLLPKPTIIPKTERPGRPVQRVAGLSRYAEAALDRAARAIIGAPKGEQEATLNGEAFSIGTLAGAGGVPTDFACKVLLWAASQMPNYKPAPWRPREIEYKVNRAFADGMRHPRGGYNAA